MKKVIFVVIAAGSILGSTLSSPAQTAQESGQLLVIEPLQSYESAPKKKLAFGCCCAA